ncbi:uncharacterized protein LOC127074976 [Lathyrus oleraceus]|uniref:uncharacterized protein LOC127074976 n=1 Tax=Pisum sativum TaxID=3888 RepID=UPI001FC5CC95|nr:uncharacterized protein LOC127074976 [Pisum sativum]
MASTEAIIQFGILILTLSLCFLMHYLRNQKTQSKTRTRNKIRQPEPNRHMNQASRHLNRARSTTNKTHHAKNALSEADQALAITPRDPSVHILRARALYIMNHRTSAIKSLDTALSLPAAKFLPPEERADLLVFRAEMKLAVNRKRRVESAMEDIEEAIRVSGEENDNSEALCLLGKCYEWKGMREEAKNAYEKVLDVEPGSAEARIGLKRVGP